MTKRQLDKDILDGLRALNRLRQRRSKYGNIKVQEGSLSFDSKREYARWKDLQLLAKGDRIRKLRRQVRYPLAVNGLLICTYVADFVYEDYVGGNWIDRVEDSKGKRTREYLMKKKLMLAIHQVEIYET